MFEPKMEKVVDPLLAKIRSDNPIEKQKLLKKKLHSEKRNAEKELVKDARFVNQAKLFKQMVADDDRRRKVKEIMGELSNQEGEVRKIKRMKYKL